MSALLVWFFCDKRALTTLLFYVVCDVPYHRDIYRLSEALTVLCPSLPSVYLLADVAQFGGGVGEVLGWGQLGAGCFLIKASQKMLFLARALLCLPQTGTAS